MKKKVLLAALGFTSLVLGSIVLAQGAGGDSNMGIGGVAHTVTTNVANIARLVTAAAYVAGMAFAIGAIVKFKAHKDNPNQIPIGTPIALLFIGAALIFIPTVFKVSGQTLFGASGEVAGVSGITSFSGGNVGK